MTSKSFASLAACLLSISLVTSVAVAADEKNDAAIQMSATGIADAVPDTALLGLTVLRTAKTARVALDENNAAMSGVLAEMKSAGVDAKDLQTSGFSIQPRYHYPKAVNGQRPPPVLVGYAVSNRLSVRIRNLTEVGNILDKAVTLGVNKVGGIKFVVDDPAQLLKTARQNAMRNAIEKAKTLTDAAGISLGRILAISEQRGRPRPNVMMESQSLMQKGAPAVPVAAGDVSYSVTVNVRWALVQ